MAGMSLNCNLTISKTWPHPIWIWLIITI